MPRRAGRLGGAHRAVDGEARDAGERGDRLGEVAALAHEDRPDQVGRRQARLRDQVADRGVRRRRRGRASGKGAIGVIGVLAVGRRAPGVARAHDALKPFTIRSRGG